MEYVFVLAVILNLLQFYIYLLIKKHNKAILDRVFEGAPHKNNPAHLLKKALFYTNPFEWRGIKEGYIKFLLFVNLLMFIYIVVRLFTG
ncbi:hypothetical protein GCM10007916_27770 [Psychromonas marina]|uniref:YggT family protein n=1 Tax=Psychromonas marina TaxID=88364 RepID=A0ABQ6E2X0_9GAMM|nr:hypothetical protein GCM10007916_27770 [Psychromonas marina]